MFNAIQNPISKPSQGLFTNLWADPKERVPSLRGWLFGPLIELTTRNKATFALYPQAPRGVVIDGYLLGGPAGGTVPPKFLAALQAQMRDNPGNDPD